ncbi:hypothetical protein Tco_0812088 [Tanacetum coccineum]
MGCHFYNPHENKVSVARHAELFENSLKYTRSEWESHFARSEWEYHGDGVACIKRHRRDLSSDDIRKLTMASGRNRLISDLEDSIP